MRISRELLIISDQALELCTTEFFTMLDFEAPVVSKRSAALKVFF